MRAAILAAGRGSRLGSVIPKALSRLANGQTILGRQLQELGRHLPVEHVFVVIGYGCQIMMNAYPDPTFVFNPAFADENTAGSLRRVLRRIDDDVLILNGDLVFRRGALEPLLRSPESAMLVVEGPVGDEEMKYRL